MITISTQGYTSKPTNIRTIEYVRKNIELDEIAQYILDGHVISANFNYEENSVITQTNRTLQKFLGTHFVMLDLDDDVQMDLSELNESLKLKPTLSYTTYSHHQVGKGNRYRLLYFFHEMITDVDVYRHLYDIIVEVNHIVVKDGCGRNPVQNVFGTNCTLSDFSFINSDQVYSIDEVMALEPNDKKLITFFKRGGESIMDCNDTFKREIVITNQTFLEDYNNMAIGELINKYVNVYPNIQETPLPIVSEDIPYIEYPANYTCIRRRWIPFEVNRSNGEKIGTITKIRRIRDGEGRRRKLFLNGILRRLITNDAISYDNLLYNLLYEFYYYYEHTDISKFTIKGIADRIWNANLDKYEGLKGADHRFRVNQLYCEKYGLRPKQVRQIAMKYYTNEKIGELYDCLLSDKENIEKFKKYGLIISISTLKRWRKENGICKYRKKGTTPS